MVITMKKICLLLIILGLFLFGCTAPNSNDLSENPPVEDPSDPSNPPSEGIPEEPIEPPKKPNDEEKAMLKAIQNSSGLAMTEAQNYVESTIRDIIANEAITSSLLGTKYIIDSSESGKSIKGIFYLLDRIDGQLVWRADITKYELFGNQPHGEYKISGTANYSGIENNTYQNFFLSAEIKNYFPQNFPGYGDDAKGVHIINGDFTFSDKDLNPETGRLTSVMFYIEYIDEDDTTHIYDSLFNTYYWPDTNKETEKEGYEKVDDTYFWPWWLPGTYM